MRCDCRQFEFLLTGLDIIGYLSHQKKFACDSLPIGENRMKKFQSVSEIQGV
jgi:hypothetical protein